MKFDGCVLFCNLVFILADLACPSSSYQKPQYCPPSQRYDVHQFPPRCLDCPRIISNSVRLSMVSTQNIDTGNFKTGFSAGIPQNNTCGCWRAKNKTVISIGLNASWVVSGLSFQHADQKQWLRSFSVSVSGDNNNNATFLDWGTFTHSNFSASKTVLFRYPVRASFLRITVNEYVNHMINHTKGFNTQVKALVSNSEPFSCVCASLPTGECCPMPNMEIKNNTCVTCMDPTDIHTVVVDGCGRCKAGTTPKSGSGSTKCVPILLFQYSGSSSSSTSSSVLTVDDKNKNNRFNISTSTNNNNNDNNNQNNETWTVHMDVESRHSAIMLVFFLTTSDELPCLPPVSTTTCLYSFSREFKPILWDIDLNETSGLLPVTRSSRGVNLQYLQFDRGRMSLVLNRTSIRSWAECSGISLCIGKLGVMFIDAIESSPSLFFVDVIRYPLIFDLTPSPPPVMTTDSMVFHFSRFPALTSVELHHIADRNQYIIWAPTTRANVTAVKWDDSPYQEAIIEVDGTMTFPPPPSAWVTMSLIAGGQQYTVVPPIPIVVKSSLFGLVRGVRRAVHVNIAYGKAFKPAPEAGDTEQLITISAVSDEPARLVRLTSDVDGLFTAYTSSKGFITDTRRVLDLVVACNGVMSVNSMVTWLETIMGLMDTGLASFTTLCCERVRNGDVSKLYWLVPVKRADLRRNEVVDVKIEAVFS